MSHDGSRGGLLANFLAAIDRCIGSTYSQEYKGSVERLAVKVIQLLASYYVGLIVIEELQERNFANATFRNEVLLLFLKIMNLGIPVILVGNPLAFTTIMDHSQDLRRLLSTEPATFWPYEFTDLEWREGLVPAAWNHNVMPVFTPLTDSIADLLDKHSGGLPDFLVSVCKGAQRYALDQGAEQVLPQHIEGYCRTSEAMREYEDLVNGLAKKNLALLSRFVDIPLMDFADRWGIPKEQALALMNPSKPTVKHVTPKAAEPPLDASALGSAMRSSYARDRTRQEKRKARRETLKTLPTTDMRNGAVADQLLEGMEAMKRKLTGG